MTFFFFLIHFGHIFWRYHECSPNYRFQSLGHWNYPQTPCAPCITPLLGFLTASVIPQYPLRAVFLTPQSPPRCHCLVTYSCSGLNYLHYDPQIPLQPPLMLLHPPPPLTVLTRPDSSSLWLQSESLLQRGPMKRDYSISLTHKSLIDLWIFSRQREGRTDNTLLCVSASSADFCRHIWRERRSKKKPFNRWINWMTTDEEDLPVL